MAYGTAKVDVLQSSTAGAPPQFNDGNGTQTGTLCRAWVNFNGVTTTTIRSSFNVSSVTRTGTGSYTINFTNALPDLNYLTIGSSWYNGVTASLFANLAAPSSTASKTISTQNAGATGAVDTDHCCVAFFR